MNDLQYLHKRLVSLIFELGDLQLHIFFLAPAGAANQVTILVGFITSIGVSFAIVYLFLSAE